MKLTGKLLGYLSRVFDRGPGAVLALRVRYAGTSMRWTVSDGVLRTTVTGGPGADLTLQLSLYTVAGLAAVVAVQPGYSVEYVAGADVAGLSALTLIDASGDQNASNGDHLNAYTSVLWAFLEAQAGELTLLRAAVDEALAQMSMRSAADEWVDEHGGYYGFPREPGEPDAVYALRVIASIGRPLGNNIAIEQAINTSLGGLNARVTDVPAQAFTVPYAGTSYGLFDVVYSIALDGDDDLSVYTERVRRLVEQVRDAGTHMRTISVRGDLADAYPVQELASEALDVSVGMSIVESAALQLNLHDGSRLRNGSITYDSGSESLQLTIITNGVAAPPESI